METIRAVFAGCALLAGLGAVAGEITVYKQHNLSGDSLPMRGPIRDLAVHNFHDQISSIVVHSGEWEVCTQPNYRGDCVVLKPGVYRALETRINHRIESMREAPGYAVTRSPADAAPSTEASNAAALELFAGNGFKGRPRAVHRDTHTLLETGYDATAASLVVREGVWQLCTEPGYQGVCRVFTPGRYTDLAGLGNQVVSVRRLSSRP